MKCFNTVPFPFFWVPGVSLTLYLSKEKVSVSSMQAPLDQCRLLPNPSHRKCCDLLIVHHSCVGSTDGNSKEQNILRVWLACQGVQQRLAFLNEQRSFTVKPDGISPAPDYWFHWGQRPKGLPFRLNYNTTAAIPQVPCVRSRDGVTETYHTLALNYQAMTRY